MHGQTVKKLEPSAGVIISFHGVHAERGGESELQLRDIRELKDNGQVPLGEYSERSSATLRPSV